MIQFGQIGSGGAAGAQQAHADNQPLESGRMNRAFRFAVSCCNRECLASCKDKAIQIYRVCAPLFKFGITCSLLAFGAYNSVIVGVPGMIQSFLNNDTETQTKATLAFLTGVAQLMIWKNRHGDADRNRDVNDTLIESTAGGIAAVGSFLPATSIGQFFYNQIKAPIVTKIAVGVLAQTASGAVIAGVATIATVLLIKGAFHLCGRAREYCLRRQDPA